MSLHRSHRIRRIGLIQGLALAAALAVAPAFAQPGDASLSVTVFTRDKDSGLLADRLRERARASGEIRVIVGLSTPTRSETTISGAAAEAQRVALRAAQDRVVARALGSSDARGVVRFDYVPYVSMFIGVAELDRLLADGEVVSVQEDVAVPPLLADSTKLIHANDVWKKGVRGVKHVVAVLDTGVSLIHPMLVGRIVSEACFSTNHAPSTATSVCKGKAEQDTKPGAGKSCPSNISGCGHGTHVTSIAVGKSTTLSGVAPRAGAIAMQVFSRLTNCGTAPSPCARTFQTDQIKGLERVFKLRKKFNIDAVNMSLGGGQFASACDSASPALKTAIDNLRSAGIATVIASGNDGFTGFISSPACLSNAIAVGNTTKTDLVAASSNHSDQVKLMAPGTDITAAAPPKKYASLTGTSMAAPHVAGAFALLRDAKRTASINDVVAALSCSGKTVHRREEPTGSSELDPQKPRIDLLGAHDWLRSPPDNRREWPFSNVKEALDWTPFLGEWKISGGHYSPSLTDRRIVGSYIANCSRSFEVVATMTLDEESNFDYFGNSGIYFKATINQAQKTLSGYWFAYNSCETSELGFCTGAPEQPRGQAVVWYLGNYNLETLKGAAEIKCSEQAPVNVNAANTLKVISNGSRHRFFLNGALICEREDSTFTTGSLMVGAFIAPTGVNPFRLEELKIRSTDDGPDAAPLSVFDASAAEPTPIPEGMSPAGSFRVAR